MLSVNGLQAHYGAAKILHNVSFQVNVGEIVALLGRNGAGKSTTMKSIMGLVAPSAGEVKFGGTIINGKMPYQIARLGLGYVPEERRIFTSLTVEENLRMGRRPPRTGTASWTRERLYELFPNLADMAGRKGSQMSGGEQQMLTIARTLMGNPTTILLDEPSEGLAPKIVEQMAHAIQSIKASGVAIVLSEQNMHFASLVSDRACVIEKGQVRYTGAMSELKANDEIRRNYLAL
jgi:branched-chain amino acid transport system ATP-binding protein